MILQWRREPLNHGFLLPLGCATSYSLITVSWQVYPLSKSLAHATAATRSTLILTQWNSKIRISSQRETFVSWLIGQRALERQFRASSLQACTAIFISEVRHASGGWVTGRIEGGAQGATDFFATRTLMLCKREL
jgi:hypothetical protein